MSVMMTFAAVYGVLQLFVVSWPTRTVRLSTVMLAVAAGLFACGTAAALLEFGYTRAMADETRSLVQVVRTTGYSMAPWTEELVKATPLLLAGLSAKVRRQWGLTDFVVLGAGLGAGFGLLESLIRYSLDADRSLARPDGGWIVPDSLSPPYIPGPMQILTAWLPAPSDSLGLGHSTPTATATFTHLAWTAVAGLGVGLLCRSPAWLKPFSLVPMAIAVTHHTLNNYVAVEPRRGGRRDALQYLDGHLWAISVAALGLAMVIDTWHVHRGKGELADTLLASERIDGDGVAALTRYAALRFPWSSLVAFRFARLRRSLCYARVAQVTDPDTVELRRTVAGIAARMNETADEHAWRTVDSRSRLRAAWAGSRRRRWLMLIPCLLSLPSLLFLGVGSFKSGVGLQDFFAAGIGLRLLTGCVVAAPAWLGWQLAVLLRTWAPATAQPLGERLVVHRLRLGSAVGTAVSGTLLVRRGLDDAPHGRPVHVMHLLEALDGLLVHLGFALILLSLLTFFPPATGLALAGGGALAETMTAQAALVTARLGFAGVILMAVGADGSAAERSGGRKTPEEEQPRSTDPVQAEEVGAARERKVAELTGGKIPSGAPGKPGLKITKPGAGTTDVDVIGADGSYIAVGGPAKARNLAKFGEKCHILKYAAEQRGVRAQVYLEEGTPDAALAVARRILGDANVHTFTR
ncbi:PrsW family glutamic-type intramembrane protease [Streptomyces sp. NPDC048182]|uniref:PrsW family glutamic-type intramembrane protease n=1 Tax=Streptomyces sp. NPDC048182 TaxID=3365507 RepID=UPI0037235692